MARDSTYRHYNLNKQGRQTLNITQFGGVDFSSQRFNVASHRAIDLQNFLYKDGIIQKRGGYEELFDIKPISYLVKSFDSSEAQSTIVNVNPVNFNGIWSFVAEDNQKHIIAHIGNLLFEITNHDNESIDFIPLSNEIATFLGSDNLPYHRYFRYEDYKSFAFVGSNRLWFLGGNKFMVIRFLSDSTLSIMPVEDSEQTFIPTTTISIAYKNAITSGRSGLDYANLLTMWRKNTLLSGIGKKESDYTRTLYYEYTLDAPLIVPNMDSEIANMLAVAKANRFTALSNKSKQALSQIHLIIEERGEY